MEPISRSAAGRRERLPGEHGLTVETVPKPATSRTLFGNDRPLELEIGSGKGTFLLAESGARPEANFLGIEYARRYWVFAADRLRRAARSNARVVLAEARAFLRDFVDNESLSSIHVYFPDPWPKTRHRRRRLIQPSFVEELISKLKPGGRLSIATDHENYFEQIATAVRGSSLVEAAFEPALGALKSETVGSNFERKYRREGRNIFILAAAKRN
jgi:tRNA (guanine-N7-)-methyltransferase